MKFLSEYDFEIKHIKGKENQAIGALKRRAHEVHVESISMYISNIKYQIIASENSNQHYLEIKETLQKCIFQHKFNSYELKEDGILMYKGKVYVSNYNELKNEVLKEMHNV